MPDTLSLAYPRDEWSWYRQQIDRADGTVAPTAYYGVLFILTVTWWLVTRPVALLYWPLRWFRS